MGDSTTNQFLNCSFLGQIVCLTHVKKNLQNKLGKKTTFQNNAPSMIPLEKAQTLLKADKIMLRDTHIADGVRRIKENRWIIKIKCMVVILFGWRGGGGRERRTGRYEQSG